MRICVRELLSAGRIFGYKCAMIEEDWRSERFILCIEDQFCVVYRGLQDYSFFVLKFPYTHTDAKIISVRSKNCNTKDVIFSFHFSTIHT